MLRDVMDTPGTIPLRAGVNAGRVFTGDFGPPYRRAYAVFGDAINTAARVTARAEKDQLLATEIVLERSRALFATTPVEPFQAKGKASPSGPRTRRARRDTGDPGRGDAAHRARARARDAARALRPGGGRSGLRGRDRRRARARQVAPGRRALRRVPGLRVLVARCEEYESATPYVALRALLGSALGLEPGAVASRAERRLREAVARTEPTLARWIPLLGILLGLDLEATPETAGLDGRFLRETLATVLVRFLDVLFPDVAAVLVVEDAQFLDEASADLLRRLVGPGGFERHGLVVTHGEPSTTWLQADDVALTAVAFALAPLTERAAVEILQLATDDQPLRPHEVEELARRSGGARSSSSSCSTWRGSPGRPKASRTPSRRSRPPRSTGSSRPTGRCCATRRCSACASTGACSPSRSASTTRVSRGSAGSSSRIPRAAVSASARRSCATPRTRGSPSAGAASSTAASRMRSSAAPRARTRRPRSRSTSSRRSATPRRGGTPASPASARGPSGRTWRRAASSRRRSGRRGACTGSSARSARASGSRSAPYARRQASSTGRSQPCGARPGSSTTIRSSGRASSPCARARASGEVRTASRSARPPRASGPSRR